MKSPNCRVLKPCFSQKNMVVLPNLCVKCGAQLSLRNEKRDFLLITARSNTAKLLSPKNALCRKCVAHNRQIKFVVSQILLFLLILSILFSLFSLAKYKNSQDIGSFIKFFLSMLGCGVSAILEFFIWKESPVGKYFRYEVLRTEKGYFYLKNQRYATQFIKTNKNSIKFKKFGKKETKILYEKSVS